MLRRHLVGRLLPCVLFLLLLTAAGVFLAVKLPSALAPIAAGERLLSLCAALFVLRKAPAESRPYRLFLLLVPWLGAAVCFFLRPKRRVRPSPAAPFSDGTANAVASIAACAGFQSGFAEDVCYFCTGKEMSERLFADLNAAKREILLDYYILSHGRFFDTVLQILEQKAKCGVAVELVCDGFGSAGLPRRLKGQLKARGIEMHVFHPLCPIPLAKLNARDHRKLTLIDRRIAYVGGVNLADEYIGEKIRFGHWKDSAVRLEGDVAGEFAALFGKERKAAPNPSRGGVLCVPFADNAGASLCTGEEIFLRLIASAQRRITLCTPYLIPTERLFSALKSSARAGVDVRLLLPHIPDKKTVFLLSRGYARELMEAGVRVREYAAGFLHAKSLTADGKYAAIGSYNLDRRSLGTQAECGAFFSDEALTAAVDRDFASLWETSVPVKKASFWENLVQTLLLPFAPWV